MKKDKKASNPMLSADSAFRHSFYLMLEMVEQAENLAKDFQYIHR